MTDEVSAAIKAHRDRLKELRVNRPARACLSEIKVKTEAARHEMVAALYRASWVADEKRFK